jgi:hypothetical protein
MALTQPNIKSIFTTAEGRPLGDDGISKQLIVPGMQTQCFQLGT